GASLRSLLLRWAGLLMVVSLLAAMAATRLAERSNVGVPAAFFSIVAKNGIAILTMLVLAEVTAWREILLALRKLGMPTMLVSTLLFMERYIHVLVEEVGRMRV